MANFVIEVYEVYARKIHVKDVDDRAEAIRSVGEGDGRPFGMPQLLFKDENRGMDASLFSPEELEEIKKGNEVSHGIVRSIRSVEKA